LSCTLEEEEEVGEDKHSAYFAQLTYCRMFTTVIERATPDQTVMHVQLSSGVTI